MLFQRSFKINRNFSDISESWMKFKSNGYSDTMINNTISQVYSEYKQKNIIDTDEKKKRTKYN